MIWLTVSINLEKARTKKEAYDNGLSGFEGQNPRTCAQVIDKLLIDVITDAIYNTRTNASVHRIEARQMAESVLKALGQSNKPMEKKDEL